MRSASLCATRPPSSPMRSCTAVPRRISSSGARHAPFSIHNRFFAAIFTIACHVLSAARSTSIATFPLDELVTLFCTIFAIPGSLLSRNRDRRSAARNRTLNLACLQSSLSDYQNYLMIPRSQTETTIEIPFFFFGITMGNLCQVSFPALTI